MTNDDSDHTVLLRGLDHVGVSLAQNLLDEAGIPHLVHGPDFDIAELGSAVHDQLRLRAILVPREALARAREVLEEAWGELPGS